MLHGGRINNAIKINFPEEVNFYRYGNFDLARLISLDNINDYTEKDYSRITDICRSEPNYSILFKERKFIKKRTGLHPRYTIDDSKFWIYEQSKKFLNGKACTFIIRNSSDNIIGAIEIMSPPEESEIGYWADPEQKGSMTNALTKINDLARLAGYKGLFAWIATDNVKSKQLVERVGFICSNETKLHKEYSKLHVKYNLEL